MNFDPAYLVEFIIRICLETGVGREKVVIEDISPRPQDILSLSKWLPLPQGYVCFPCLHVGTLVDSQAGHRLNP